MNICLQVQNAVDLQTVITDRIGEALRAEIDLAIASADPGDLAILLEGLRRWRADDDEKEQGGALIGAVAAAIFGAEGLRALLDRTAG